MYYVSRIAGVAAALGLAGASWFSILLARADAEFRKKTPEGVARAVELTPRNTAYLSLRALQMEYDGGDPRPVLERMAALNPLASAPRIRLGLDAEVRGDLQTAERRLLEAARVDQQFEPRWTLANFYFRRQGGAVGNQDFWKWMRLALERSYGDRRPAFDLMWRMSSDAAEILRAVPEEREVVGAYLSYTLDHHRLDAAGPAAVKLARWRDEGDRALLNGTLDALLDQAGVDASRGEEARRIWVELGYAAPSGIASPDFENPRGGHGFDWRLLESPGVTHVAEDAPRAHKIVLNGEQPESCDLVKQVVGVRAGGRYTLRWEARTSGIESPTGLEWRVAGRRISLGASEAWSAGEFPWTAASDWEAVTLAYQRPLGQVRANGSVELRHVTLAEAAK